MFRGVKCDNIPKGSLECTYIRERPLYLYLARDMRTKARPTTYERAWAYGEVEQWVEDEVERELADMSGSLEQLAGLEEEEEEGEESGSSVHCSENCLRKY